MKASTALYVKTILSTMSCVHGRLLKTKLEKKVLVTRQGYVRFVTTSAIVHAKSCSTRAHHRAVCPSPMGLSAALLTNLVRDYKFNG